MLRLGRAAAKAAQTVSKVETKRKGAPTEDRFFFRGCALLARAGHALVRDAGDRVGHAMPRPAL